MSTLTLEPGSPEASAGPRRPYKAMRSLWPREHGAYAQLAAPLMTSLVLRIPSLDAILIALGACLAFLANEPLLVLLGHRGRHMRHEHGRRAQRRLAALGSAALVAAGAGLALAGQQTVATAGLAAGAGTVLLVLAWARLEKTLGGELVAAIALPAAAAPVAVASGVSPYAAAMLWCAWSVGYAATVLAVHRVIARHRRNASAVDTMLGIALTATMLGSIALALREPRALVATPLVIAALSLVSRPPRATYLRAIGVALVIASVASALVAVVTDR